MQSVFGVVVCIMCDVLLLLITQEFCVLFVEIIRTGFFFRTETTDFGNGANKSKLVDRVRHLCELFDRPCLILEKDRVKPADDKRPRQL